MLVSQGIDVCMQYHKAHSKPHTLRSYEFILSKFREQFEDRDISSLSHEEILEFMNHVCTQGPDREQGVPATPTSDRSSTSSGITWIKTF